MFHKDNEPYSCKTLDKMFHKSKINFSPRSVSLITEYSQLPYEIELKVKNRQNVFENAYRFNSNGADIYFYTLKFYSSIKFEEIKVLFNKFITNMTIKDYKWLYDNAYLGALAQFDKIPHYIYSEFFDHEDFIPPLIRDNDFSNDLECFAKFAYAYLKAAQGSDEEPKFQFEIKNNNENMLII